MLCAILDGLILVVLVIDDFYQSISEHDLAIFVEDDVLR